MEEVNQRIQSEICHETIIKISDEVLQDTYQESLAVKNQTQIMTERLLLHGVAKEQISSILYDPIVISNFLVPPGTKGNLRGNMFNHIVAQHIREMNLDSSRFDVRFEEQRDFNPTSEIPDWSIQDRETKRGIIGMNQVALWGGGQQTNRASKYLTDPRYNTPDCKLLCVVCYDVSFKSQRSKVFHLVKSGFENDTLCYIKNLSKIIRTFFQIVV